MLSVKLNYYARWWPLMYLMSFIPFRSVSVAYLTNS